MSCQTLLPDPDCLHLLHMEADTDTITIVVTTTSDEVTCPRCSHRTSRVHSRYVRLPADLPWMGCSVRLQLRVRRFFCTNETCSQKIFAERLPNVVAPFARRTVRLADLLALVGCALGGEAGQRLSTRMGASTSPDSFLRQIRSQAALVSATPRVLGVDDFAFRRGRRYGTILIDLEKRIPIDLLPDRTAETLAAWLLAHPGVEIISRDRAGAYAEGASKGAPRAVQVADRWHLLRNLGEALELLFLRHALVLKQALTTASETLAASPSLMEETKSPAQISSEDPVPTPLVSASPIDEHRQALRQHRYEEVCRLAGQGMTISDIHRKTGLDRKTIRKYLQAEHLPDRAKRQPRRSILGPYRSYLRERVESGCHNGAKLLREIQKQGYKGGASIVRAYVAELEQCTPGLPEKEKKKRHTFSPSRLCWLLFRHDEDLSEEDRLEVATLRAAHTEVHQACEFAQTFIQMVRERESLSLEPWLQQAQESDLPELCRFAGGIERDKAAVQAALSLPWSNGPVEAQVQKLKLVKRQMFGRANFDLLRQRVLYRA
ncbi:MAG: ISL3 family transposase [Ktedonobacteraceae bacterium]